MKCVFVPTPDPKVLMCIRCPMTVPVHLKDLIANCAAPRRYSIVPWRKRAWRFLRSMLKWGKKRFAVVDDAVLSRRMNACARCDARKRQMCQPCGCYLPLKQVMATEGCSLGLWEQTCDNGCGQQKRS